MSEVDRALCRKAARECIELACATTDPDTKRLLSIRAQEWIKLAYSDHDDKLAELINDFNAKQFGRPVAQRQPMQQQQQKKKADK